MQAKTLDYVFYDSLQKLVGVEMINHIELFANIAFKAQTQSRKTLAVLSQLKVPNQAVFIKQQNNAVNQQINNDLKSNSEKNKKVANELLRENKNANLELGRKKETVNAYSEVEALGEFHRS